MSGLLRHISGRSRYRAELPICVEYGGAAIEVRPNLFFFRAYGKSMIIDWKVYGSTGGTGPHPVSLGGTAFSPKGGEGRGDFHSFAGVVKRHDD